MNAYIIWTANGSRLWLADDASHAIEQHQNAFPGDASEVVQALAMVDLTDWEGYDVSDPADREIILAGYRFPRRYA